MSLINKMLRDLDARHAPTEDRAALPKDVHVRELPPEQKSLRLPLILVGVAVCAAAGYFLFETAEPPAPPPVAKITPPPAPAPVAAPVAPQQPVVQEVPPVAVTAPPKAPGSSSGDGSKKKQGEVTSLRLDTRLPGIKDRTTDEMPAALPPAAPTPRPAAAAKESAPAASGPTSIDKRPRTSMANDAADGEYRKALSALRRGATSEAVEGFHKTLQLDVHHVSARQALLSLLVGQQQWTEAQSVMEEGLNLDPEQSGWAMALARLQLESGKLPEAVETLARHARYAEQNADYISFHALLLQKQKRSREAAERYRAALALRPTESRWWYGLGLVLESDQKPQEARDAFQKAKDTGNLPPELTAAVEQRLR